MNDTTLGIVPQVSERVLRFIARTREKGLDVRLSDDGLWIELYHSGNGTLLCARPVSDFDGT